MAIFDVVENYIDAAGYRRVRIQIDGGESVLFKFSTDMTVAQMREEASVWYANMLLSEQAQRDEIIKRRQISNGCDRYLAGGLTNAQKATLLDALVAEWKD